MAARSPIDRSRSFIMKSLDVGMPVGVLYVLMSSVYKDSPATDEPWVYEF